MVKRRGEKLFDIEISVPTLRSSLEKLKQRESVTSEKEYLIWEKKYSSSMKKKKKIKDRRG